ncbi:uncharacterized protein y4mH-like [Saccoglossus kowalevskii]|uniref:Uncharacterized protein LOC100377047 n=1 Tax=Saccoglossus kowalevskii TaxID=10224 RepID=A0ABM0MTT0_SACKO|nr:PREDICTED: uncharacterized protein LOC100377047 [Saccoglossus kowalevskii]
MEFIDPHFHVWDTLEIAKTGHSAKLLGGPGKEFPIYCTEDYRVDFESVDGMVCKGCVYIEGISSVPLAEAMWASGECLNLVGETSVCDFRVVARCDLSDPDAKKRLRRLKSISGVVGVRQIMSHHPSNPTLTWPLVERADYMQDKDWLIGYAALGKLDLSFELQVNQHQLADFVQVAQRYPNTNVVINHMGMLNMNESDALDIWRKGMAALAECKNVSVKISFIDFAVPQWYKDEKANEEVRGYIREVIVMFGSDRCMFASNFPVDKYGGVTMDQLYSNYRKFVADLDEKSQYDLFYGTAARFYKFDTE